MASLRFPSNYEEELGRRGSLSEVFMKTHTRADGIFVDQKAKQVAETYEKTIEEKLSEMNEDGLHTSDNSPEHSSHRTLNIGQKNEIFLQCTQTNIKGNPFSFGSLVETLNKRKRNESYASPSTVQDLQDQLRRKIAEHEAENARRDEEHRQSQASFQKLLAFMKEKNPELAEFMASASTDHEPATQAMRVGTTQATAAASSPLSNTSSTQ
ncbi:PREDICTED: uncharacterized protein LOC109131252 [Camelina sativa]|uniref:Uncharacterized protein LOC109131252 n=1 Tax=Camelina sativa TaxID=90675 RepID=A0ABM1RER0_CAMSA|nr:PREDICTED: uncharacterized protein LOC109131252 [Camelina sativa]